MTPEQIQIIKEAIEFLILIENELNNPGIIVHKEFADKITSVKSNLTKLLDENL